MIFKTQSKWLSLFYLSPMGGEAHRTDIQKRDNSRGLSTMQMRYPALTSLGSAVSSIVLGKALEWMCVWLWMDIDVPNTLLHSMASSPTAM